MKIALFGGAFDPPHLGHKVVTNSLIKNKIVGQVWFVPVFKHPWADRYGKHQLTDYAKRVKMLELTISAKLNETQKTANGAYGELLLDSESDELSKNQKIAHFKDVSFTYDTLQYFSSKNPQDEFSWVMGSEYLDRFDDFLKGHPKLMDYTFYIYPRAGYGLDENLKKSNMIFLNDMPEITASSTEIKKRIKAKQDYSEMVLPVVDQYIRQEKLYL